MKKEFEKVRDEQWNNIKILRKVHTWSEGADWAFKWCQEKIFKDWVHIDKLKQQNKQLDQQAKIIEELKEAIIVIASEHKPRHDSEEYWNEIPHEKCATVLATDTKIARETLATVKEMESNYQDDKENKSSQ